MIRHSLTIHSVLPYIYKCGSTYRAAFDIGSNQCRPHVSQVTEHAITARGTNQRPFVTIFRDLCRGGKSNPVTNVTRPLGGVAENIQCSQYYYCACTAAESNNFSTLGTTLVQCKLTCQICYPESIACLHTTYSNQ